MALESRLEASDVDFRNAKAAVKRALAISLVAGLLTCVLGIVRLIASSASEPGTAASAPSGIPLDLVFGFSLIACFVAGRWIPATVMGFALALWIIGLILPFVDAPALALLATASPGGVALTLAKVAVLVGLLQGLSGGIRMRRLFSARPG